MISNMGHQYLFILRPISHKIAESAEDFRRRIDILTDDELEYLLGLALIGKEDIRSLEEDDIDSFIDVIAERLSIDKSRELKLYLGIV
ncbi:MAG: hypothetical protein LRZ92_06045 [Methanosarcinaceae archaeon]|nr:hypothetical protein [Methanosarcinaceae archaeon]